MQLDDRLILIIRAKFNSILLYASCFALLNWLIYSRFYESTYPTLKAIIEFRKEKTFKKKTYTYIIGIIIQWQVLPFLTNCPVFEMFFRHSTLFNVRLTARKSYLAPKKMQSLVQSSTIYIKLLHGSSAHCPHDTPTDHLSLMWNFFKLSGDWLIYLQIRPRVVMKYIVWHVDIFYDYILYHNNI